MDSGSEDGSFPNGCINSIDEELKPSPLFMSQNGYHVVNAEDEEEALIKLIHQEPEDDPGFAVLEAFPAPPMSAGICSNIKTCLKNTFKRPRYLLANIVYIFYATMVVTIDHWGLKDNATVQSSMYTSLNVIHIFNACQYIYMWKAFGVPYISFLVVPDYLNITEGSIYLVSSTLYFYEDVSGVLTSVHYLETVASIVELISATGWFWQWYKTYDRLPGMTVSTTIIITKTTKTAQF